MNLLNRIKIKIQYYLYKQLNELLQFEETVRELEKQSKRRFQSMETEINKISDTNKAIQENFNISVDIHHPQTKSENWAVISIKGNNNYIKFGRFNNKNIIEIERFLRQFEHSNITVDCPLGMSDLFKW